MYIGEAWDATRPKRVTPPKPLTNVRNVVAEQNPEQGIILAVIDSVDSVTAPTVATVCPNNTYPSFTGFTIPANLGVTFQMAPFPFVAPAKGIAYFNNSTQHDGGSLCYVDMKLKKIISIETGNSTTAPTDYSSLFQYIKHDGAFNTTGDFQNPAPIDTTQLQGNPSPSTPPVFSTGGTPGAFTYFGVTAGASVGCYDAKVSFALTVTKPVWLAELGYVAVPSGTQTNPLIPPFTTGAIHGSVTANVSGSYTITFHGFVGGIRYDCYCFFIDAAGGSSYATFLNTTAANAVQIANSNLPQMPAPSSQHISASSIVASTVSSGYHSDIAGGTTSGIVDFKVTFTFNDTSVPLASTWAQRWMFLTRQTSGASTTDATTYLASPATNFFLLKSTQSFTNGDAVQLFCGGAQGLVYDIAVALEDAVGTLSNVIPMAQNIKLGNGISAPAFNPGGSQGNMLWNPLFASSLNGWSILNPGGHIAIAESDNNGGSLHLSSSTATSAETGLLQQYVGAWNSGYGTVKASQQYTISGYVIVNSGTAKIESQTQAGATVDSSIMSPSANAQFVTMSFTTGATDTGFLAKFEGIANSSGQLDVYWYDVQVEQGDTPSYRRPGPLPGKIFPIAFAGIPAADSSYFNSGQISGRHFAGGNPTDFSPFVDSSGRTLQNRHDLAVLQGSVTGVSKNLVPDSDMAFGFNAYWTNAGMSGIGVVAAGGYSNGVYYVGNGTPSGYHYAASSQFYLVAGVTYFLSGVIDATYAQYGLSWGIYDVNIATGYFSVYQAAGVKSRIGGSFTVPTSGYYKVVSDTSNSIITNAAGVSWSQPMVQVGSVMTAYIPNVVDASTGYLVMGAHHPSVGNTFNQIADPADGTYLKPLISRRHTAVDSGVSGGGNLLINPKCAGMNDGCNGWAPYNNSLVHFASSAYFNGSIHAFASSPGVNTYALVQQYIGNVSNFGLNSARPMVFSVMVYTNSGKVQLQWQDSLGNSGASGFASGANPQLLTLNFTPANGSTYAIVKVLAENTTTETVDCYFWDMQCEYGSIPTAFGDHSGIFEHGQIFNGKGQAPSSAFLNNQGSLLNVSGTPTVTYTVTSSQITVSIPATTYTRTDRTTVTVPSYSHPWGGLSPSVTYDFDVWYDAVANAFNSQIYGAAGPTNAQLLSDCYCDGRVVINAALSVTTQTSGGTGGTGGTKPPPPGGGSCPAAWQLMLTKERGLLRADEIDLGMHITGPNDRWVEVTEATKLRAPIWTYVLTDGETEESFDVNDTHAIMDTHGEWRKVRDLKPGDKLKGENTELTVVYANYLIDDWYVALEVEGHIYSMGKATIHNPITF